MGMREDLSAFLMHKTSCIRGRRRVNRHTALGEWAHRPFLLPRVGAERVSINTLSDKCRSDKQESASTPPAPLEKRAVPDFSTEDCRLRRYHDVTYDPAELA